MTAQEFKAEVSRYVAARRATRAMSIATMQVNAAQKMLKGSGANLEMTIENNRIASMGFSFPTKISKMQNEAMNSIDLAMSMMRAALLVCSDAEVVVSIRQDKGVWVCSALQDLCGGFIPSEELLDHFEESALGFGE